MDIRNYYQSFSPNIRREINKNLLISWTHSSTALEGNTFSFGDTFFFLFHGITVRGKSFQEHCEIKAHANAIDVVNNIFINQNEFTEQDIKKLHRIIIPDVIDIYSPVGEYKIEDNGTHILDDSNTTRYMLYPSPQSSKAMMSQWIEIFNSYYKLDDFDQSTAINIYADILLKFLSIHPFADGNGRLARILANIPLIKHGYPPIIIDPDQRKEYLLLLNKISPPDRNYSLQKTFDKHLLDLFIKFCSLSWDNTLKTIKEFVKNIPS